MERYHVFKLGLAILFYTAYCIKPMLVSGLRSSLVANQTLNADDYFVYYQGVDGTPGVDFPVLSYIPRTTFSCDGIESGYYADLDTDCQVFHICEDGKKISFLCPNGTIFEQEDLICEWWYKVNCTNAPNLYEESAEHLREDLARRKSSRRITLDGGETNHGAVMRTEESASVSARQNGRTYSVNTASANVQVPRPSSTRHGNSIPVDKDTQSLPKKRYNDAETGNFINNINYNSNRVPSSGGKQVYIRSTTPSPLGGFSSNLADLPSRKQSIPGRGSIKFSSSFGNKAEDFSASTPDYVKDEYDLEFPKHKSEINVAPQPTSGSNLVKIDSSKVDLRQPKQKSTVDLTRNDILNRRLEQSDSDELQIPQETAAFAPSSYNSIQSTTRKFTTVGIHPNHRPTYSDLKRPDFSTPKFINTINSVTPQYITTQSINSGKPFIGSTVGASIFNRNSGKPQQNQETTLPISTTERYISSTYQTIVNVDQDLVSTLPPDFTSFQDIGTTKSVDHATVYGSFSRVPATTPAPTSGSGVEVKLGKDVDKVTIQLSKSLGGGSPPKYSTVAPLLATDGFVRISAGLSQPVVGSNAQANSGTGPGRSSTRPLLSPTQNGIATSATPSGGKTLGIGSVAVGSTVVPNILSFPDGRSPSPGDSKDFTNNSPILTSENSVTDYQSTITVTDTRAGDFETVTITNKPNDLNNTSDKGKGITCCQGLDGSFSDDNFPRQALASSTTTRNTPEPHVTGFLALAGGSATTIVPNAPVTTNVLEPLGKGQLTGSGAGEGTIVVNDQVPTGSTASKFGGAASTVTPVHQGSTGASSYLPRDTTTSTRTASASTLVPKVPVPSRAVSSTVENGLLAVGTGSTIVPNIIVVDSTKDDTGTRFNAPSSTITPSRFNNDNSITSSPSVKESYLYSTVRSIAAATNRPHSQVTELLPLLETSSGSAGRNNGTDTYRNSYRQSFYPTRSKEDNLIKARPSVATKFQDNSLPTPDIPVGSSPSSVLLAPRPNGVIVSGQNEIGSTLSPYEAVSTYRPVGNTFPGTLTTASPFRGEPAKTNSAFFVTRNSVFRSTTPSPFGISKTTPVSRYTDSIRTLSVSPRGKEAVTSSDVPLISVTGDYSLSKSETRWPRPFHRTSNNLVDDTPTKIDSVTPTYLTYKISSARPFELPKVKATPAPTIPTPFTTVKSVQENVDNMIDVLKEIVNNPDYSSETPRPGLVIPPSAGPQTLHTLAQYFANALDGIVAEREKETGEELDKESKEKLTSLLTQMTMYRYNQLFKDTSSEEETTTLAADDELHGDDSTNLVETPQLRELAKNFSQALSSYLNDPGAFRKELETFRPTEPSSIVDDTTEPVIGDEELLNFSDADVKSSYPPLFSTPKSPAPTWGYILAAKTFDDSDVKNSLNPDLHTADTQSFVPGFNSLTASTGKGTDSTKNDLPGDHWTASPGVTRLWQSALSINPAVLNENLDSTRPVSHTTEPYISSTTESPVDVPQSEIRYDLRALPKLSLNSTQVHGILIDFVNTTKTDDSNRLQRLLKKLNTTEDEFLHRMKEIESNPLTKRLILLLISECGANVTKDLASDPVHSLAEVLESSSSNSDVATHSRTVNSDIPELVDPNLREDDQDVRALQLLNSLYAIASKFGKR